MMQECPGHGGCRSRGILWFGKSATILFGQPFFRGEALLAKGQLPAALRHRHGLRGNRVHLALFLDDFADGLLLQGDGDAALFHAAEADAENASRIADVIVRIDVDVVVQRIPDPAGMIENIRHHPNHFELPLRIASRIEGNISDRQALPQTRVKKQLWLELRLKPCQMLEILWKEHDIDRIHAMLQDIFINQAEHSVR